VWYQIPVPLLF